MSYAQQNELFAKQLGVAATVFAAPTVALELQAAHADHAGATIAFMFAANLLVRLFRKLHLVAPDVPLGPNA
jgi:hypothetical protein